MNNSNTKEHGNLLFISLSSYNTLKNSSHNDILNYFRTKFENIFVFCWDKKLYQQEKNIHYFSGNLLRWYKKLNFLPKLEYIYINDFFVGGTFGVYLKKRTNTKLVFRCGSPWKYQLDSLSSIIKTGIVSLTKPMVIKNCDKVVYNSKAIVQKQYNHNWEVVYNGVDTEMFKAMKVKKISKKLNVLFIGRIRKDKGLDYLFKATKGIKDKIYLGIIGKGPKLNEYKKKYKFAQYYGKIDHHRLCRIINKYDIVVLPSLTKSSESFPNVLLEAMACSKPIIGTKIWGIPEIIINGENGFLIPEKKSESLKKMINYMVNKQKLIEKMGIAGRKIVEKRFEKEKQIQKLYKALLERC